MKYIYVLFTDLLRRMACQSWSTSLFLELVPCKNALKLCNPVGTPTIIKVGRKELHVKRGTNIYNEIILLAVVANFYASLYVLLYIGSTFYTVLVIHFTFQFQQRSP